MESYDESGGELADFRGQPSALEAVTRAEVDIQIATAKRFPRNLTKFLSKAKSMVALDPDLAAECTYYLPARSGRKTDPPLTGPSVRLAEIVAVCWGNLRVVGRITDDDGKFITAQAMAHDLEENVAYGVEVRRGVTSRDGRRYGDDMIKTTCNAAIAVATRNATYKVIPRAMVNLIEEEAQRVARGEIKSLPERTARAVAWFVGKGITEERIYEALGVAGPADMTLDLLSRLNGFKTAVNDGQATLDQVFLPAVALQETAPVTPPASRAEEVARKLIKDDPEAAARRGREPGEEG